MDIDLTQKPPEFKQDTFKGQPSGMRWFFKAKQLDCSNPEKLRTFKANRRSGDAIISKIRELGTTVLRIDREGDDKETFYRPRAVPTADSR